MIFRRKAFAVALMMTYVATTAEAAAPIAPQELAQLLNDAFERAQQK